MSKSLVKWSGLKVLGRGCRSLLEDLQTMWSFTASFIFFWFYCVSLYIWLYILYASIYFLYYILFLLCLYILTVIYVPFCVFCFIALFYVLFVCRCVLYCTVLLPPGVNPIAVNKCIISYQNIKQQMYLIKYNNEINLWQSRNSYMFWSLGAFPRESSRTKKYKGQYADLGIRCAH